MRPVSTFCSAQCASVEISNNLGLSNNFTVLPIELHKIIIILIIYQISNSIRRSLASRYRYRFQSMAMSSHAPSSRGEQNYRYFSQANINGQQHDDALSNSRQQTDTRAPRRQRRHESGTYTHTGTNTINRILDSHSSKQTHIHTYKYKSTCRNEIKC